MKCLLLFGLAAVWAGQVDSLLLAPRERCPPTASVRGTCHDCVCGTDGYYNCRERPCQNHTHNLEVEMSDKDCDPYRKYRDDATFCTCDGQGYWEYVECREKFHRLPPKSQLPSKNLRTDIACTPKSLYLIDCNICECGINGTIELSSCTNRVCKPGRKSDHCNTGDILRTKNELCACSDINLYIDRLCIPISERSMQKIERNAIDSILDIGKSWMRMNSNQQNTDKCTAIKMDCNKCFCTKIGVLACTDKYCVPPAKKSLRSKGRAEIYSLPQLQTNKSLRHSNHFPEIAEGEVCKPNKMYRLDCNICRCNSDNHLLCTKMKCMDENQKDQVRKKILNLKAKAKKLLFPELPDGDCVPGKLYQKECYGCYCGSDKTALCSDKMRACDTEDPPQVPLDFRPAFKDSELETLPTLPNTASRCEPGRTYKVNCNTCLCLPNYNLICDHLLCLSLDDMNRIEAQRMSGKSCKETKPASSPCVNCECVNETLVCSHEVGCRRSMPDRALHGSPQKIHPKKMLALNLETGEKCVPQAVYKQDCNKCYCQDDGSLRCTAKMCLNYVQSLKLKKHRLYLEKHGL